MMEIVRPGLLDLVMDLGRPGFRAQGVPEGGAADARALILANRLVGNIDGAAGLELLLRGPTLRFPQGGRIALGGADMQARCDGIPVPRGRALEISPGGELELGMAGTALRAYLAVAGGIEAPRVMGSCATFLPGGFGGWQGRALKAGDALSVGIAGGSRKGTLTYAACDKTLRILPGPQLPGFTDAALKMLTAGEYKMSTDANRLGLRLSGPVLEYAEGEIASQAVLPGAIQVPPDGQPIILGWDGPVTGGYPVAAAIIAADLPCLAQLRPGDSLRFAFVTPEEAQAAWRRQQENIDKAITWDD
jgi:biotin-dependent carboxylase-like uncharacterized protein